MLYIVCLLLIIATINVNVNSCTEIGFFLNVWEIRIVIYGHVSLCEVMENKRNYYTFLVKSRKSYILVEILTVRISYDRNLPWNFHSV